MLSTWDPPQASTDDEPVLGDPSHPYSSGMETFRRGSFTFRVVDRGSTHGEAVVLLHGFPGSAHTWDRVIPGITGAGYRTLAPTQRGYSPEARPAGRRPYRLAELVADVVALADQADVERFHLVGHDWGGMVAWQLAAQHPQRLRSLTALSTPHPRAMLRAMLTGAQAFHSWYIAVFQLPWLPEAILGPAGGRRFRATLEGSGLGPAEAQAYVEQLADPAALTCALNWYRALPLQGLSGRPAGPVTVPTLYVWGDGDRFLGRTAAEQTYRYVDGPYRYQVLRGVSHWIPETAVDQLVPLLREHFGAHRH